MPEEVILIPIFLLVKVSSFKVPFLEHVDSESEIFKIFQRIFFFCLDLELLFEF